ncbi:MAG: hypothetical protein ACRYF3_01505, partial [Janthinobacterium lividum]
LDVRADRLAVAAERQVLARLEAGCSAPVGAYARFHGELLRLTVAVEGPQGLVRRTAQAEVDDEDAARALGAHVAADLLAAELKGAARTPQGTSVAFGGGAQDHPLDRADHGPRPDSESGS